MPSAGPSVATIRPNFLETVVSGLFFYLVSSAGRGGGESHAPPSALLAPLARTLPVLAQRMGGVRILNRASSARGLVLPRKSRARLPGPV